MKLILSNKAIFKFILSVQFTGTHRVLTAPCHFFFLHLQNICISMHDDVSSRQIQFSLLLCKLKISTFICRIHLHTVYVHEMCEGFPRFSNMFFLSLLQKNRKILSLKCNSHSNAVNRFCARFAISLFRIFFFNPTLNQQSTD